MSDIISVKCPKCGKEVLWSLDNPSSNPYRPFCSASCKNSDLLAWSNEEYKLSREVGQDEEELLLDENLSDTLSNQVKNNSTIN